VRSLKYSSLGSHTEFRKGGVSLPIRSLRPSFVGLTDGDAVDLPSAPPGRFASCGRGERSAVRGRRFLSLPHLCIGQFRELNPNAEAGFENGTATGASPEIFSRPFVFDIPVRLFVRAEEHRPLLRWR